MEFIENQTYDEIAIGATASLTRTLTQGDIQLFAVMSGDVNPAHLDEEYAKSDLFRKIIAHGMWGGALISTLLGTKLPGPGTIYLSQTLRFRRPVAVGDTVTVSVTAVAKDDEKHRVTFDCQCVNQRGEAVISGSAEVLAPTEKVKRPRAILPEVHLHDRGARYRQLIALTSGLEPIRMAVAHPVEPNVLLGVVEAARAGLIIPILVGPAARIASAAATAGVDISAYTLVPTQHSDEAIARAIAMARDGAADALMLGKPGNSHTTTFIQALIASDSGLGSGRRMSHIFALDVPTYPRPLFITDSAINTNPDLETKRDIVQNAIDLLHAIVPWTPRVAILSAVELVNPKIRSTLDAAALCKMVDRGQITGGIVDGPLSFDNAVSEEAALADGTTSPVAGKADILMAPDLESGNLLTEQLEYLANAQSAGLVLGARVPIVLNRRTDNPLTQQAACAIALLQAQHKRTGKPKI
ncbi:MAG: bifunctional enoyl-CoA hydratase/phosphate acetyltransferase [Kouleothrix sp.]|nr:bifunctional enoyl-CoA hydratase/phosphate acetyltransferase [Kouleothrix sp.]